jgi:hypothetical protein
MATTRTYAGAAVQVIVGGAKLSGLAKGTAVTISQSGDSTSTEVGLDGEVTRTVNQDRSGTAKIVLMQLSESNAVLAAMAKSDKEDADAVVNFMVKSGDVMLCSAQAWVQKPADYAFGDASGTREWTLGLAEIEINEPGGPKSANIVEAIKDFFEAVF